MAGLLALMLLTAARRPARTGCHGELVSLAEQDRTRWNQALIAEGVALLTAVLPRRAVGEYQLQDAIATIHDEAASAEQAVGTDQYGTSRFVPPRSRPSHRLSSWLLAVIDYWQQCA